jgi:hypothetical protein
MRQYCEATATEQRARLRRRAFDPLPADLLASQLGVRLGTPDALESLSSVEREVLNASTTWSAAIVSCDPWWVIYHSLMHELSHILLGHAMAIFDARTGVFKRDSKQEDEAIFLGGCLQIPRRGLLWAVQRKMSLGQISEHFCASAAMVRFRSNVTGVRLD